MGRCTCSKDAQITCIVHPTEVSLKQRIAELEAELEVYKDLERRYVAARYEYMNENLRLSLDYISAVGQTQMHLEENQRLKAKVADLAWVTELVPPAATWTKELKRLTKENKRLKSLLRTARGSSFRWPEHFKAEVDATLQEND